MRALVYTLIVLLVIAHQDFWWWDDSTTLIAGFVPIGLFYHAMVSLAAGALWWMAMKYCWPKGLDDETAITESTEA